MYHFIESGHSYKFSCWSMSIEWGNSPLHLEKVESESAESYFCKLVWKGNMLKAGGLYVYIWTKSHYLLIKILSYYWQMLFFFKRPIFMYNHWYIPIIFVNKEWKRAVNLYFILGANVQSDLNHIFPLDSYNSHFPLKRIIHFPMCYTSSSGPVFRNVIF